MPNNSDEVATERYNMLLELLETHPALLIQRLPELETETHYGIEISCYEGQHCSWWDHWDEVKHA